VTWLTFAGDREIEALRLITGYWRAEFEELFNFQRFAQKST
jgi:hypothetical protein